MVVFVDSHGMFTNNPEEAETCFYTAYGSSMEYGNVSIITNSSWTRHPEGDTYTRDSSSDITL